MKEGIEKKDSKGKHQNPRTIRKEIQFSDSEFALVSQKALEAKLYPAVSLLSNKRTKLLMLNY